MMVLHKNKIVLLLVILFITACAAKTTTPKGVYHLVKKNETLWKIAQAYRYDAKEIARINDLPESGQINEGTVLFIPQADRAIDIPATVAGTKPAPSAPAKEKQPPEPEKPAVAAEKEKAAVTAGHPPIDTFGANFMWPVTGKVSSKFGRQSELIRLGDGTKINSTRYNNGIKIDAPEGTPVVASESGIIDKTDTFKYYGKTIIIKHGRGYMTVYSYLQEIAVTEGDTVKKGQMIGRVGKLQRSDRSALHFEIRHRNRAKNPQFYLPKVKGGNNKKETP